jgi:hypothetical protein
MSTLACDDNVLGGRTGQQRSTATRASCVQNEPRLADTPFLRPGPETLSEAIPVFFIGRNRAGHWVARDADGKSGGLFWRKQSAIRFAARGAVPAQCATIFPTETIELDLKNQGNPLLAYTDVTRRLRSVGAILSVLLLMVVFAGFVALKTVIFLSRLNY